MNLLCRIVRYAHCGCTHQRFAVDALPLVQTEAGRRLVTWLLRHHGRYLTGAIDPDIRFRDFQNQIIHVDEGYWGGAPRVAHQWYDRLQRYLRQNRYSDAAHAAGVLSHYFTDIVNPLHTSAGDRETLVHRPLELSVDFAYETIRQTWLDDELRFVMQLSDRPGWLGAMMLHSARLAHQHFHSLVNGYQFHEGIESPEEGLSDHAIRILSEWFGLAITGWARIIERVAADAEALRRSQLPVASMIEPTFGALLTSPIGIWKRRLFRARELVACEELAKEYFRTGKLVDNLPAEVDVKRRVIEVFHNEQRYRIEKERRARDWARIRGQKTDDGAIGEETTGEETATDTRGTHPGPSVREEKVYPPSQHIPRVPLGCDSLNLSPFDQLIHAPSIGVKTAKRMTAIHMHTVGQFLAEDADQLAARLDTYWIDADMLRRWQAQATLMCQIPELTSRDAQILAGAGYTSAGDLAADDPRLVRSKIARFALTSAGRRYLRGRPAPSDAVIDQWTQDARELDFSDTPLRRVA